jgi:ASC-1-like (ASCH) protein
MTIFIKSVRQPWFNHIKDGKKIVEGRLFKDDIKEMNEGDTIIFKCPDDSNLEITVSIIKIVKYNNFEDYLRAERLKNCLPGVKKISDGKDIYYNFYSKNDEKKYGVAAIRFKL